MEITKLKGIGPKTADLLNRLSVYTIEDLVGFYPRDYDVYGEPVFVADISDDEIGHIIAIDGMIVKSVQAYNTGRVKIISSTIKDLKGNFIKCTWFNMPFLKNTLKIGSRYIFRGYISNKNKTFLLEQPKIYTLAEYKNLQGSMQPIYSLTKGLSNSVVIKAVKQTLEIFKTTLEKEYIPDCIRQKYNLSEHNFSLVQIHFPKTFEEYKMARKRLAFEEFFLFILAVRSLKESNKRLPNSHVIRNDIKTSKFIDGLPFDLTDAQLRTWNEIVENMSGSNMMNRLIQGDVGSGKTIIAVLALMNTAFAGFQGAMMVPTEVLARQQYDSICKMFEEYEIDINVELLVGSMNSGAKKKAYSRIENGTAKIIIGTHALIQEKVIYSDLALVITDEQHRFGVNQRKMIAQKGCSPHVLVMSATPIPRTLAIIVYGDLDISVIDKMPSNRLKIKNCVVDESYRDRAYSFMKKEIDDGHQVYVICPLVEESEGMEAENVQDYSKKLSDKFGSSISVEYLHGKMNAKDKNYIMEEFANGNIDILVSTTVIEVGVNVPNATVIMIENADRFGLAQLHQLRGRVGRGKYQSYCIFVSSSKSKKTKQRLDILNKSNDGFEIAEEDLKLRGPGDFFGVRQSGEFDFGIADIFADSRVLKEASEAADYIMLDDNWMDRDDNKYLSARVQEYTFKCLDKINI